MLVLSRKIGQKIIIGKHLVEFKILEITLGISRPCVKIGITAPPELSVHREEIYERIEAGENKGNE